MVAFIRHRGHGIHPHRIRIRTLLLTGALLAGSSPALAQELPASPPPPSAVVDTAGVAIGIARELAVQGRTDESESLLRYILGRYPGTPAAREAEALLSGLLASRRAGRGDTQFIAWNTLLAAWLGVAIPLAADSDEPAAYGAALLIAPPVGFFASRAYAKSHPISLGQSGAYFWATIWGTWQAIGWREVLEIGDTESCYDYGYGEECYSETPDNAGVKAALVGGVVGVVGGLLLLNQDIRAGDATLASHASVWSTFYGLAIAGMADAEDDALLTSALIAGNLGLVGAIPVARAWHPSRQRVWIMTAAGLAGGLAGLGVDFLVQPDEDAVAIAIPTAGATAGLLTGALLTRDAEWRDEAWGGPSFDALLALDEGPRLGLPLPKPGTATILDHEVRRKRVPILELRLAQARF